VDIVWLALVLVGLASLAGVMWSLYRIWVEHFSEHSRLFGRRLQAIGEIASSGRVAAMQVRKFSESEWFNHWLIEKPLSHQIDQQLLKAGLSQTVSDFLLITGMSGCLGLILGYWQSGLLIGLLCLIAGLILPYGILGVIVSRRQTKLEEQLPEVFDFIARSMQAGHAFNAALQMAATEAPEPVATEFKLAFNQVNLGMPIQKALSELAQRVDCADMRYFAIAVMINREVGGDLSGLLRNVSELIRERIKLRMAIYAMTAEGRFSAWILGLLPLALAGLLYAMNPEFIAPLWREESGRRLVTYAFLLMMFGIFWMSRLTKVRV